MATETPPEPSPQPTQAPRHWKSVAAWLGGLAISGAILAGLLLVIDTAEIVAAARNADPLWLLYASLAFCTVTLLRWARVVLLARGANARALLGVSAGHALLNKVLPLRTGELTFPLLYRRATGAPLRAGVVLLAALRVSELACLLPLYAAALAMYAADVHWLAIVLSAIFGAGLQLALPVALRLVGRLKVLRQAREEIDALSRGRLLGLAAINSLVWLSLFALYFTSLRAFGVDVSPPQAVVGAGGAIVTNLLPINGIGSVGTLEAGWTAGLTATGAAAAPVLTAGLAMHAITIVGNVPFLLVGLRLLLRRPPGPTGTSGTETAALIGD
jgi:uncharacterized membrane protein YbhN (UPF0104 family)